MKSHSPLPTPKAILFDLDGTLVDSAPDLAAAINRLRTEEGMAPVAYDVLRPLASAGSPGLIKAAFQLTKQDAGYQALADRFIAHYSNAIADQSTLFEGIPELLNELEKKNIQWGIVTNKIDRLTTLLVKSIGLSGAGCVISGDTTPYPKPHPAPLLEAAKRLNIAPQSCWYVGDDLRDIQAGRTAGSFTIAANWGYCTDSHTWGADYIVETPFQLLDLIQ